MVHRDMGSGGSDQIGTDMPPKATDFAPLATSSSSSINRKAIYSWAFHCFGNLSMQCAHIFSVLLVAGRQSAPAYYSVPSIELLLTFLCPNVRHRFAEMQLTRVTSKY